MTGKLRWRCYSCGREFKFWTGENGAQTHAYVVHHPRIECVIEEAGK